MQPRKKGDNAMKLTREMAVRILEIEKEKTAFVSESARARDYATWSELVERAKGFMDHEDNRIILQEIKG
jgi:hypothetical protein